MVVTARQQQIAEFLADPGRGLSEHALIVARAVAGADEPLSIAGVWEKIAVPPYPADLAEINVVRTLHELRSAGCVRRVIASPDSVGAYEWVAPWRP